MKKGKRNSMLTSTQMILLYVIIVFCIIVGLRQPAFFSVATVINIARAAIFSACFALCEMIVIISGGIDVSFPAIGCVAMYVPMYLIDKGMGSQSAWFCFGVAILIGLGFGLFNSILIAVLDIPPLIATLATSSIASGGAVTIFGSHDYTSLPEGLQKIYNTNLITYVDPNTGFSYVLNILVLVPIIASIIVAFLLKRTMLGRGLYAIGGAKHAARVAGLNVRGLQFFAYIFSVVFDAVTAKIYTTLMKSARISALMGDEMIIIAACVIGGVRITGGHGTVSGTLLGVLLITLVQNSLNMLGIPTSWQRFVVGIIILLGTILTSWQTKRSLKAEKA